MDRYEIEQRAAVLTCARSLLPPPIGIGPVPWRHMGRTRHGLDCGGVIVWVFGTCGLTPLDFDTGYYPPGFMLHSDQPRFQGFIEAYARKVEREARDGDIALFQVGRVLAHCAIVDQWPRVIHAVRESQEVQYGDVSGGELKVKFRGLWSFKEWT